MTKCRFVSEFRPAPQPKPRWSRQYYGRRKRGRPPPSNHPDRHSQIMNSKARSIFGKNVDDLISIEQRVHRGETLNIVPLMKNKRRADGESNVAAMIRINSGLFRLMLIPQFQRPLTPAIPSSPDANGAPFLEASAKQIVPKAAAQIILTSGKSTEALIQIQNPYRAQRFHPKVALDRAARYASTQAPLAPRYRARPDQIGRHDRHSRAQL